MARINWKQPISLSLSKEVLKLIRDAAKQKGSRSAVVEDAILRCYGNGGKQ